MSPTTTEQTQQAQDAPPPQVETTSVLASPTEPRPAPTEPPSVEPSFYMRGLLAATAGNQPASDPGHLLGQRLELMAIGQRGRLLVDAADPHLHEVDLGHAVCGIAVADVMRHASVDRIERESTMEFEDDSSHARNTHSAIFAEVKVDEELGVVRVTRIVSAVAAGRILNTKTAHSQIMGGVVWGIGMALHEEAAIDHAFGRVMNANIAEYHVPVHADVHDIDVIFVEERDDIINPLGIKGAGEAGVIPVPAVMAQALENALEPIGVRVTEMPLNPGEIRRLVRGREV